MQITCFEEAGFAVVRPTGRLSLRTSHDLRDTLLKAAAEQPATLVCDLREVTADASALTVLLVVAEQLRVWPSCTFVLMATDEHVRSLLDRIGVSRGTPLVSSIPEVAGALSASARPVRAFLRLSPGNDAPGRARAFLASSVPASSRDGDDTAAAAALVLDELVTNAVLHARTDIEILVSVRPDRLRVAVADGSDRAPAPRTAGEEDENGRGLALVDALSERWGVLPRRSGKVVWAVVRARGLS